MIAFPLAAVSLCFSREYSHQFTKNIIDALQQYMATNRCRMLQYNLQNADAFPEVIDGKMCFEFFVLADADSNRTLAHMSNPAMSRCADSALIKALTALNVKKAHELEAEVA